MQGFILTNEYTMYILFIGDDLMETKVQKWGNSDGIRIPSSILKELNIKTNDRINITREDDKIIITKCNKEKISLKERIKNYKGSNLCKDFVWDESVGKEIW